MLAAVNAIWLPTLEPERGDEAVTTGSSVK